MTTVTLDEVNAEIAASPRPEIHLGRILLTAYCGLFAAIGMLIGGTQYLVSSAWAAFKLGYWAGAKITPEMRAKRAAARKARTQPSRQQ